MITFDRDDPEWKKKIRSHLQEKIAEEKNLSTFEGELSNILVEAKLNSSARQRLLSETKYWASQEFDITEWRTE